MNMNCSYIKESVYAAFLQNQKNTENFTSSLSHITLVYNVHSEKTNLNCTYSKEVKKSEISADLVDSMFYMCNQIIECYSIVYRKVSLDRIIINADVGILGINLSSVTVKCIFPFNGHFKDIFTSMIWGEKLEYIERPTTEFDIVCKKKKIESITLVTSYQDNIENVLGVDISDWFLDSFEKLLFKIKNKVDFTYLKLSFDLLDRIVLHPKICQLTPKSQLSFHNSFDKKSVYEVTHELYMVLSILGGMSINHLTFKTDTCKSYQISFVLVHHDNNNFMTLDAPVPTIQCWKNLFDNIIHSYSLPNIDLNLNQQLDVFVVSTDQGFQITLDKYCFAKTNIRKQTTNLVLHNIYSLNSLIKNQAKIICLEVTKTPSLIQAIKVYIEPCFAKEANINMIMDFSDLLITEGVADYKFELIDNKYFLLQCVYHSGSLT